MNLDAVIERYVKEQRDKYRLLASKTQELLSSILRANSIQTHSITSREKDPDTLRTKIRNQAKNYDDPLSEITDLAGVRIITYFPKDVDRILPLIEKEFSVDRENSVDKRKTADPSFFGYASVHLVVEFLPARLELPEYALFSGMKCETQVRTILQHAWAEIEHDIVYKSAEEIPFELRRRFASLAGLLELADREFESLRKDEVEVREQIQKRIRKEDIDLPVDSESLYSYLRRYHKEIELNRYRLQLFLRLLKSTNVGTIQALDTILTPSELTEADEVIRHEFESGCRTSRTQECLLRYFVAVGLFSKMSLDTIAKAAQCPARERPIRRRSTKKRVSDRD